MHYELRIKKGAASRNKKMFGIKFVPTSERRVSLRTEECAERTWERGTGAPLVPLDLTALS